MSNEAATESTPAPKRMGRPSVVADAIPFERRAKATGYVATAFSVSSIAGVPLSLLLADALGWPYELRQVFPKPEWVLGKPAFVPGLDHLDLERSAPLAPPWRALAGTCAVTRSAPGSYTVISGRPGMAMSPRSTATCATMPSNGARTT